MLCSWGLGLDHHFPLRSSCFIAAENAHSANSIAGFSYSGLCLPNSESGSGHRRFQNLEVLLSFLVSSPGPVFLLSLTLRALPVSPSDLSVCCLALSLQLVGCVAFNKLLHLSVGLL